MSDELEHMLRDTMVQAANSAPTPTGIPSRSDATPRRWLAPTLIAGAVAGVAVVTTMVSAGDGGSPPVDPAATSKANEPCVPNDRLVQPTPSSTGELTGEHLAARLNDLAHDVGDGVSLTYQAPDKYWMVVDSGQSAIVPDLIRQVGSVPTAEAVTIRESCTSLQELQQVQAQVSRDFGSSEGVSSDIDLLRGHVIVFTDDQTIADQIRHQYGDLAAVEPGGIDCASSCRATSVVPQSISPTEDQPPTRNPIETAGSTRQVRAPDGGCP